MTGTRRQVHLTDARVERLRPGKTEYVVWDKATAGLGVRVRPSGHRSFVWHGHVDGAAVRATIGSAVLKSVEEARRDSLALRSGKGPEGRKERSAIPCFRDFVRREWETAFRNRCGQSWQSRAERMLNKQLLPAFGEMRLDRIGPSSIERWFDAYSVSAPGGANKALQLLRQILNAAVSAGYASGNPAQSITRNPRRKITRFLSGEEIDRLHGILDRLVEERPCRRQQADIVRLLLLTGCRRSEILKLKWVEVHGDMLGLTRSKTGPRKVWLSEAAQAVIARQPRSGSAFVFPSPLDPSRPRSDHLALWYQARKEAGIDDVRLHDLRHTVASQAVTRGVALSTVAKMLGHSNPKMTLRYAHVSDRDVEAAAERVGKVIEQAMEPEAMADERPRAARRSRRTRKP